MSPRFGNSSSVARSITLALSHSGRRLGVNLSRYWEHGRHDLILSTYLNPSSYSDWKSFAEDHFAVSLLRKYPYLSCSYSPQDRRNKAIIGFYASEERCTQVNTLFSRECRIPNHIYSRLVWAREWIRSVLQDFSWDCAVRFCDFGPGASVGIKRLRSHACEKIGSLKPTVSGHCLPLLEAYLRFDPHMAETIGDITVVSGSKVTTVPKDAKKDRLIAIEPLWNMFFQKGIGGLIRQNLKRVGLDLDRGQSANQALAKEGSLSGRLSTIDLSAASDCISKSLVEFLLPASWHHAMSLCRSEVTLIGDKSIVLRKFSSMGNGFTFELESLIFLALALAVNPRNRVRHDVLVYGDDIILPCNDTPALIEVLECVGFTTNKDKSFVSGPFRESCGKHYFEGHDVTPFFLKKKIETAHDLFWLANSLRRYAFRLYGSSYGCDGSVKAAYDHLVGMLPERLRRLSVPDGYGDDGLLRDFDEVSPGTVRNTPHGVEGYTTQVLAKRFKNKRFGGMPALVKKLWSSRKDLELSEGSAYDLLKPQPVRAQVRRLYVRRWSTLGPWV